MDPARPTNGSIQISNETACGQRKAAHRNAFATVDGNEAAAYVAYQLNELLAIYPITPSSPIAEWCDQWAAEGKRNLWGTTPAIVEMQSEGGAVGAQSPASNPLADRSVRSCGGSAAAHRLRQSGHFLPGRRRFTRSVNRKLPQTFAKNA
jgi:hypothetical protein